MLVVIRIDSSSQIGSGHLMRCLTLAGQLKKQGAEVAFICRDLEGNLTELVKKQGYELHLLPRAENDDTLIGYAAWLTVSQERDAEETISIIEKLSAVNRLVVDSYAIDETWEKLLRPYVQEIFVIDDLANRRHDCDVLLDQNYYLDKEHRYDGLVPEACKLLLGPEHALLREEFYEAKKHLRKRDGSIHNILVFYGGSDLTDETTKAIHALIELNLPGVTADVIVGASNKQKGKISELCAQHEFLHYHEQVSNMAEFMNNADLMLGAGGTTTWERYFLQLPAIVTAIADNQVKVCEDCAKAGFVDYLGYYDKVSFETIEKAILKYISSDYGGKIEWN